MATPTDNDDGTIDGLALDDPNESTAIRQAIKDRLAKLSPEEGRKWLELMLTMMTKEEIWPIS